MVTKELVKNIAVLSRLDISEEELDVLTKDMQGMIALADEVSAVESDPNEEDFDNINNLSNVFREDIVVPSWPREEILKNVDGGEDGCFLVKLRG